MLTEVKGYGYGSLVAPVLALVVLVQLLLSFVKLVKKRKRTEEAFAAFPCLKRHIVFGNLDKMTNNEEAFQYAKEQFADAPYGFQLWAGPFNACLILTHPKTVQAILSTAEPKDEFTYGMVKPWLGDGLLLSQGDKWFRNRRLLTPGFHFDILKPYVQIFNECTKTMLEKWTTNCNKGSLEMFENISLLTLDSLLKCIFSQESHCQVSGKSHPYIQAVYKLTRMVEDRVHFPPYYSDVIYHLTYSGYKWRQTLNTVHQYSQNVIKQRQTVLKLEEEKGVKKTRKYVDFLDILLAARDEDGIGLTDKEIRDEVDTFMFEGHDTTASAISWCLYNLAKNPQHQQKCRQEIDKILDSKDEDVIEWDDISKLTYLTMCLKESMRLNPPVPFVGRRLTKPLVIPDLQVTIPQGEWIGISFMALHDNTYIWEDSETFDPLRFTPENCQTRSPYAFVPFSAGPRNCIGQNFALNEMKVTIALILRNFELTVDEGVPARRVSALVMRAEHGLPLFVQPRIRNSNPGKGEI
ncbi:cytochrome P450 4F2-like [Glandiceps talaboti]